jgi:hypothetical protein
MCNKIEIYKFPNEMNEIHDCINYAVNSREESKRIRNFHHRPQLFPSHYDSIHVKCSLVLIEEGEKERGTN